MIVIQNASIVAAQDEVIYSAKYSPERVSVILIIYCLLMYWWLSFTYDIVRDIYDGIIRGEGPLHFLALGSILLLLLVPILHVAFSPLFFKEIIFYPDRVEVVRRILGCKIVYYSSAQVEKGSLTEGYLIEETRGKGKPLRTRFFYDIELVFFSSEAREKVETIFDYLSGDSSKKNPRILERSVLPREVLLARTSRGERRVPRLPPTR